MARGLRQRGEHDGGAQRQDPGARTVTVRRLIASRSPAPAGAPSPRRSAPRAGGRSRRPAPPRRPSASKTSAKCAGVPAPEEAMTGIDTASFTARISSRSKPDFVPSRSMELSRISPAPSRSQVAASVTASTGRPSRPPLTVHWNQQKRSPFGPGSAVGKTRCGMPVRRGDPDPARVDRDHDRLVAVDARDLLDRGFARWPCRCAGTPRRSCTASEPIEILSAPERKYSLATSSADQRRPAASV